MNRESMETLIAIAGNLGRNVRQLSGIGIEWIELDYVLEDLHQFILDESGVTYTADYNDKTLDSGSYWDDVFVMYENGQITEEQLVTMLESEVANNGEE